MEKKIARDAMLRDFEQKERIGNDNEEKNDAIKMNL
jgi:hypothetical protein